MDPARNPNFLDDLMSESPWPEVEGEPTLAVAYVEWHLDRRATCQAALASAPPRHDARALTAGGVEARILLDGTAYVLRITRQGKLILTK